MLYVKSLINFYPVYCTTRLMYHKKFSYMHMHILVHHTIKYVWICTFIKCCCRCFIDLEQQFSKLGTDTICHVFQLTIFAM